MAQEESVFGLLTRGEQDSQRGPKIISYKNIAPSQPSDVKVKMHADSSQVRFGAGTAAAERGPRLLAPWGV